MAPEVSVVVSTQNRWPLMARTSLRAALLQEDVELEVLVVDDGSDERAPGDLPGLDDPRVRVLRHDAPLGVASARNAGIREARGAWVALLDDDDVWAPRKLRSQVDAAAAAGAGFAYSGAVATMALYFVHGQRYLLGGILFLLANLAFGCSIVVYNAFLPELAEPDERDAVSSRGWATGYLGGALLLAANVVLYSMREDLGLSTADAVRISLLAAGIWWAVFTAIPVAVLRNRRRVLVDEHAVVTDAAPAGASDPAGSVLTGGFRQLGRTLRELPRYRQTLLFLIAYLLYNDGVQSVITLSASYADKELLLSEEVRITAILMVQFVAFGGALLLGWLATRLGAKRVVLASLLIWIAVVGLAYFLSAGAATQFYLLGAAIGIVLGGTQALSRSLYSHLIPVGKEAEYFGLYEISEKGTSFVGPLVFGLSLQLTDSYRTAIMSLVIFFVVGFFVLTQVDFRRGIAEAGNAIPHRI